MTRILVILVALAFMAASGNARAGDVPLPLPEYARINPPHPDVLAKYAAFSGKWFGVWEGSSYDFGSLHHVLIVRTIVRTTVPSADVIYAWGVAPNWNINKGEWIRVQGEFEDGTLVLKLRNHAKVTYHMHDDGTLRASYQKPNRVANWATMKRMKE